MDRRLEERIGFNEATFRRINEAMEPGPRHNGLVAYRCECARLGCAQPIELTREEYETVRADPRTFVIVDGHELPEVEDVVRRTERYAVIAKRNGGGEVAEATNPRA